MASAQHQAELIVAKAGELQELHRNLLRNAASARDTALNMVIGIRGLAMLVGPLVGWWMAWRLGKTVNEIRVSLEENTDVRSDDVPDSQYKVGDDLSHIRQQVERVGQRLRRSAEALNQAKHEVLWSDRLAAIGRLAAGVAHELRNPLTSVKLLIQYAISPANPPLSAAQFRLILDEVERMETTIQGLLDLSRSTPVQRTPFDLRETLSRAAQLVAGRADRCVVNLELDLGDVPLIVDGERQQIHQVWVKLYRNAFDSMPEGGRLEVRVRRAAAHAVQIEIRDTGCGIPEEILPMIFDPFVTSKLRGTGLGLAISQRIVEAHDGRITAANAPESGAVFLIELPLKQEDRSAAPRTGVGTTAMEQR